MFSILLLAWHEDCIFRQDLEGEL
uniref:Uncharacterized protein n=1 Tax=Rhizophora mucronata TaxID=61149 RepID=A0A2P2NWB4_RHIMU